MRKSFSIIAATLLLASGCQGVNPKHGGGLEVLGSAARVVRVFSDTGRGSAFPVMNLRGPDGKNVTVFLTAGHIGNLDKLETPEGGLAITRRLKHPTADLQLAWTTSLMRYPLVPLSRKVPVFGDRLYAVGMTYGERRITEGYAAGKVGAMSTSIAPGFSGGPVLNDKGEAVGVTQAIAFMGGQAAWFVSYYEGITAPDVRDWILSNAGAEETK